MHFWREVVLNHKTSVDLCGILSGAKDSVALCEIKNNLKLTQSSTESHREENIIIFTNQFI